MGAWGVKSLESDEGLDFEDELRKLCEGKDVVELGAIIRDLKENTWLTDDPNEIEFLYDHVTMGLAEELITFTEEGKLTFEFSDDNDEEQQWVVSKIIYTHADLDFLLEQITDIVQPKGEVHETYELWEDSNSFDEWKAHVQSLIEKLTEYKRLL